MNEIHILYSFPLRVGRTGIGMTAWHQLESLIRKGVKVDLYCASLEKPLSGLSHLRETFMPLGLKLPLRFLGTRKAAILHDRIVASTLKRVHNGIDIVHCWPSGASETLAAAKSLEIPTVLERPSAHTQYVFDVVEWECEKLGIALDRRHYAARNHKRLVREEREFELADKLLCPSEFVIETFLEKGYDRTKLAHHRYGYDPSLFSVNGNRISEPYESPFNMLYVGNCSPLKGLHFSLQAWLDSGASKKGKFFICGGMVPKYLEVVKEWLDHPSVEYLGFVRDLADRMRNCHALVLPSLAEGSALVTYESRACGCVLLVSDASGAYCTHMHDALVHKAGDVVELSVHIDLLNSDMELRTTLKQNSLAGVGDLTWQKAGEVLLGQYKRLLKNS
jgi:glycosyltransferase involved in cell wall biosynthesis